MIFQPHKHVITAEEIYLAKEIGVQFINFENRPETLLNEHFPNFTLFTFFSGLLDILEPLSLATGGITKVLSVSSNQEMIIQLYSDNFEDESFGLGFSRIFSIKNDELVVKHDFFRLPLLYRGKGVAKAIMKICLQQYVNMGVQKIIVHAALANGGYTWARYNFTVPEKAEIDSILKKAKLMLQPFQFNIVKKLYDNYYSKHPEGRAFPISKWAEISFMKSVLTGSSWHGVIDLNNQEQFYNFISYAFN